jgi:hypothetical protein
LDRLTQAIYGRVTTSFLSKENLDAGPAADNRDKFTESNP